MRGKDAWAVFALLAGLVGLAVASFRDDWVAALFFAFAIIGSAMYLDRQERRAVADEDESEFGA